MKKYILPLASLILLSIVFTACSNNATNDAASKPAAADSAAAFGTTAAAKDTSMTKATAVVYTCKMHPEVISDKPGKCPKCGMDLVKKDNLKKDSTMQGMKMDSTK